MNTITGLKTATYRTLAGAVATAVLVLGTHVQAETVATVNGTAIDSTVFDVYIQNRVEKPVEQVTAEERQTLLSELTDIYLLSTQESAKALEDDPQVAAQIELQRRGVLAQAAASEFFEGLEVSEEEIQAAYETQVAQAPRIQYKARHILVPTQSAAQDIIASLNEGADFQELAKEKSTGPSGPNGGDLGWFSPSQMVKPFADAVAQLEQGQYTKAPVQTEFGWHVIMREDSREPEAPPLENVRGSLVQSVQQQKFQDHLEDLRARSDE